MRRWVVFLILGIVTGCSYTFDSGAPQMPYVGTPPDTAGLPKLNVKPVDNERFALGKDQRVWLLMQDTQMQWQMLPMSGTPDSDTLAPEEQMQLANWHALYILRSPKGDGGVPDLGAPPPTDMGAPTSTGQVTLVVRSVGEHPGQEFTVPAGPAILVPLGADDGFAYIVFDKKLPGYLLQRRDGSFKRIVPWPKGIDPANPLKDGIFMGDSGAGLVFYDRDIDGRVVGHHTRDNRDVDLGIRPRYLPWLDANTLVTCGDDSLRVVPVDGTTPERVLDNDICHPSLQLRSGYLYYYVGTTVRKVKVDGSEAPTAVFDFGANRVLRIAKNDVVLYSTDPANRYINGVGNGLLAGWQFMERGSLSGISSDFTQLYWLEHAAQGSGTGDFTTVTLPGPGMPGGTPKTLSRNTRQVSFLGDGRILVDENRANNGVWNRIVLIDELRGHKQYVAVGANHFSSIPFTPDEYIVDVVSGASGHDLVRVKLPGVEPPPPPN